VSNLLLQVLDDGILTDSHGRRIDFSNTIIIMTSNLGAAALAALPEGQSSEAARGEVMAAVREHCAPELLNRIDEIVMFNKLGREHMGRVLDIQLDQVRALLAEKSITLDVSAGAADHLAAEGFDPAYGARPMKRLVPALSVSSSSSLFAPQLTLLLQVGAEGDTQPAGTYDPAGRVRRIQRGHGHGQPSWAGAGAGRARQWWAAAGGRGRR
jgi:hypothetical protein